MRVIYYVFDASGRKPKDQSPKRTSLLSTCTLTSRALSEARPPGAAHTQCLSCGTRARSLISKITYAWALGAVCLDHVAHDGILGKRLERGGHGEVRLAGEQHRQR